MKTNLHVVIPLNWATIGVQSAVDIMIPECLKYFEDFFQYWNIFLQSLFLIFISKYLLLTEFEVRTVSYGPSFFPLIYGPSAKPAGHKSTGKNEDP